MQQQFFCGLQLQVTPIRVLQINDLSKTKTSIDCLCNQFAGHFLYCSFDPICFYSNGAGQTTEQAFVDVCHIDGCCQTRSELYSNKLVFG